MLRPTASACRSCHTSGPTRIAPSVVAVDNNPQCRHTWPVKAVQLVRERIAYADGVFAEIVVWRLPSPLPGSKHPYKYRLAYVVSGECVLRYDNEAGKGDHRHVRGKEFNYSFRSIERVLVDFHKQVRRLNHEDGST